MLYRFGDFTLNEATRQLVLRDEEVHLSPKAFELLVFLIMHASRAVSKAELQERLWPDTFVEETNLASLVAEIRRALGDSARNPGYVRTVYGFGYRFTADVVVDPGARIGADRPKLVLVSPVGETMLMEGTSVIGRAGDATIQIDSPGVSRYHAWIRVSGREAIIEDAGSKNGTYVNGQRLTGAAPLENGHEIRLGQIALTFRISTPTSLTATIPEDMR